MNSFFSVRPRVAVALAATAMLAVAPMASAQSADVRWQPWLGCWTPATASSVDVGNISTPLVCVTPVTSSPNVAVATIANGQVVHVEQINTSGTHVAKTVDGCPGWESATWSKDGHRLLMRSEFACGNKTTVKGSAIFAISAQGEWLQIQGNTVGTNASSRAVLYRPAGVRLADNSTIDDSSAVRTVPTVSDGFAVRSMRMAAAAPVTNADALLDVASHVDPQVAQTWLTETGQRLKLSAKQLVGLADGGMPGSTIDLLVAMAYPERFSLQARDRIADDRSGRTMASRTRYRDDWDCGYGDRMLMYGYYGGSCYPGYYGSSIYGSNIYGYSDRYGYANSGYGYNNYYWGQSPIIILPRSPDGSPAGAERGRAVKGQGYTRASGSGSTSSGGSSEPRASSGSSSGSSTGSSGTTSSPPASSSGSSSSGDAGRT
ncbi:MAG: hypothetical protein M3Y64_08680, partial [Gemmatimonadota bacterium]|nr:hypothetical protein [Gemmatimonadota bacterium]